MLCLPDSDLVSEPPGDGGVGERLAGFEVRLDLARHGEWAAVLGFRVSRGLAGGASGRQLTCRGFCYGRRGAFGLFGIAVV